MFGAEETLLPLAQRYMFPIKFVVPSFLFTQLLSAFLRNDGDPALATKAVLFGGVFNVFGDYFFVFTLDMGIMGAGIATAMGSVFSLLMMMTHFFKKENTLHLVPFAAVQYLLHLLFPGDHEAFHGLRCVGGQRRSHQRHSDLSAAACGRGRQHLVCHADHGTDRGGFCGDNDAAVSEESTKNVNT